MVLNGIDRIGQYDAVLKGKRLGLITSISGVNNSLYSSIDILSENIHLQRCIHQNMEFAEM